MKLDDDYRDPYEDDELYEQHRANAQIKSAAIVISFFVILTIVIVLIASKAKNTVPANTQHTQNAYAEQQAVKESVDEVISGSTLTAQDLDFWDDYKDGTHPAIVTAPEVSSDSNSGNENGTTEMLGTISDNEADTVSENEADNDPATDGKHTLITHADGTTEWADINPYLASHGYDLSGLVYQKPFMLYYENNTKHSFVGVDI